MTADSFDPKDFAREAEDALRAAGTAPNGGNAGAQGQGSTASGWPAPEPLPQGLPAVQPFTFDLLPDAFRPWIQDVSERMQAPPDYAAAGTMVAAGSVIGRQIGIFPKRQDDWFVVPNLWGGIIGPPAQMKTPSLNEALSPVKALEGEARETFAAAVNDWAARDLVEREKKKLRTERVKRDLKGGDRTADAIAAELAAERAEEQERPHPIQRRYMTNDVTVEKLGELLRDSPHGILVFRDELTGFLHSMEREGHQSDRAFYLEAWNGTSCFTYDRIERGTTYIPAACVSLLGGIQPDPLLAYLASQAWTGAGADGLLPRFQMLVWPDTARNWINVDRWPDTAARERAATVFRRLATITRRKGAREPISGLRFTDRAQDGFDAWRSKIEARLRKGDLHPAFEAHLTKYRSLAPSIALICHLVDGGNAARPVSET